MNSVLSANIASNEEFITPIDHICLQHWLDIHIKCCKFSLKAKTSRWFNHSHTPPASPSPVLLLFHSLCLFCLHLCAFVDITVWIVLHISQASVEVPRHNSRNGLQQRSDSAQSWNRHNRINHLPRLHYNGSINGSVFNVHITTMRFVTC